MAKFIAFDELLPKHKWNNIAMVCFALFYMGHMICVDHYQKCVVIRIWFAGISKIMVLYDNIQVWLFQNLLCKVLRGTFSIAHQVDNDKLVAHCSYQKIV